MRLLLDRPVPIGTPVSVRWNNALVRGEVCFCDRLPDGRDFAASLKLEHALTDSIEIARLAQGLLGTRPPQPNPDPC